MRVLFADRLVGKLNFQPLGLLSLAAVCKAAGHSVRLADLTRPRSLFKVVEDFSPHVIGFPTVTGSHRHALSVCGHLKREFSFQSVFGGPHATFFPRMASVETVDAVCRGEGERSFVEYLERLENGNAPKETPNFVFGSHEGPKENPPAPLIQDLDSLPFGAWEILDEHPLAARFPVKPFMASRGCPFACTFCYNSALRAYYEGKGRVFRRYSPSRFVGELAAYKRRAPLTFVYIFDDTFATDLDWLAEFCALYRKDVGLPFFVNFVANAITKQRIEMLQEAGLAYVGVGLESGNEEIRKRVMNKSVTNENLRRTASLLHALRIPFEFYNILAIPGTEFRHDLETLAMNVALHPKVPEVLIYQPYPGTPLGEEAKRLGLFSGNPDEIPESFKSRTILSIPHAARVRRLFLLFRFLVLVRASNRTAAFWARLPLTPLYWLISRVTEGYIKSRQIYKIRVSPLDYVRIFYHYLKS